MTDQTNSSPFSSDAKFDSTSIAAPTPVANQGDFSVKTMQDDLTALQNKGAYRESIASPAVSRPLPEKPISQPFIQTENPAPRMAPIPTPTNTFNHIEPPKSTIEISESETMQDLGANKKSSSMKIILSIVFILILAIAGLGFYYFSLTKQTVSAPIVEPVATAPIEIETPVAKPIEQAPPAVEAPVAKFSSDQPNFLPIDINSLGADAIQASIAATSKEIATMQTSAPYEFIIVDSNNNPVSFPIFATAAKLKLSPSLLSTLGKDFSIYFYNDNSSVRLAMNIKSSNKTLLMKELIKQEKTFATDGAFLFLNDAAEIKNGTFGTGNYKNHVIKYLNVNSASNLSIDYTVIDSKLLIATSKNTLRAVIDKTEKEIPTSNAGLNNSAASSNTNSTIKTTEEPNNTTSTSVTITNKTNISNTPE